MQIQVICNWVWWFGIEEVASPAYRRDAQHYLFYHSPVAITSNTDTRNLPR